MTSFSTDPQDPARHRAAGSLRLSDRAGRLNGVIACSRGNDPWTDFGSARLAIITCWQAMRMSWRMACQQVVMQDGLKGSLAQQPDIVGVKVAPDVFANSYANDIIIMVCEAWLGTDYRILSQLNIVNPALFQAAGINHAANIRRMANLLQISSAYGRVMETVDRARMSVALYPTPKALTDDWGVARFNHELAAGAWRKLTQPRRHREKSNAEGRGLPCCNSDP